MTKMLSSLAMLAVVLTTGCRSVLPSSSIIPRAEWQSYEQAQAAFDRITPYQTTQEELACLGFDPDTTPNIQVLTYLDLTQRFLPNSSITMAELHPDVRQCIEAKDACHFYELDLTFTENRRYGNICADVFGFQQKTHVTGWDIKMLILVKDGVVTYKLRSGAPRIVRDEKKTKPLGPFQDLGSVLSRLVRPW